MFFVLGNWIAGFEGVQVDGNSEMHSHGCFPGTCKVRLHVWFQLFLFEEIHGVGVSVGYKTSQHISSDIWITQTRWWLQTCFIFKITWGNDPIWLIFFKWVETTNQQRNVFRMIRDALILLSTRVEVNQHFCPKNGGCVLGDDDTALLVYLKKKMAEGFLLESDHSKPATTCDDSKKKRGTTLGSSLEIQ